MSRNNGMTLNNPLHHRQLLTTFSCLALLVLLVLLVTSSGAKAEVAPGSAEHQAALYPSTTNYIIRRKGKRVGTHKVVFSNDSNGLMVDVESRIKITVLKVPVFKFSYTATELWQDGNLVSVNAVTNNGGKVTNAELDTTTGDVIAHSSNHWNSSVLEATQIFNTLTGNVSTVVITKIDTETLREKDTSIEATRYRYTGDIQADVWYDSDNRWVKLLFKGDDGSTITYTANPLNLTP